MNTNGLCILFAVILIGGQSCRQKSQSGEFPLIDISKSYPKKEISLQSIADIEYIPLETTDEVLLGQDSRLSFVSEKHMLIYDNRQGEIFVFNRNGKIGSHFNHRGQGDKEYNTVSSIVFDEKNAEIFVFDIASLSRILVYSISGEHKRTLKYSDDLFISGCNFDDEAMLVYDINGLRQNAYRERPYMLMSKKDGSIVSELNIHMPERYSNRGITSFMNESGQRMTMPITISITNNRNFGQDLIIADISSDTIFKLSKNKELTPFVVRTPSVHSSEPRTVWSADLTTDKFILVTKAIFDFEAIRRTQSLSTTVFSHDLKTGETSEVTFVNEDFPSGRAWSPETVDIPQKNVAASMIQLFTLKTALEEKKLKGDLEKLAASLDDDDNPVVMVVKFR